MNFPGSNPQFNAYQSPNQNQSIQEGNSGIPQTPNNQVVPYLTQSLHQNHNAVNSSTYLSYVQQQAMMNQNNPIVQIPHMYGMNYTQQYQQPNQINYPQLQNNVIPPFPNNPSIMGHPNAMMYATIPSSVSPNYLPSQVVTQQPLYQHGTMPHSNEPEKNHEFLSIMKHNTEVLKALNDSLKNKDREEKKRKLNDNASVTSQSSNDSNIAFNRGQHKKNKYKNSVDQNIIVPDSKEVIKKKFRELTTGILRYRKIQTEGNEATIEDIVNGAIDVFLQHPKKRLGEKFNPQFKYDISQAYYHASKNVFSILQDKELGKLLVTELKLNFVDYHFEIEDFNMEKMDKKYKDYICNQEKKRNFRKDMTKKIVSWSLHDNKKYKLNSWETSLALKRNQVSTNISPNQNKEPASTNISPNQNKEPASTNISPNQNKQPVQFVEEVPNKITNSNHKDVTEEKQVILENEAGSLEKTNDNNILNIDNGKFPSIDDLSIFKKPNNDGDKELTPDEEIQKYRNEIITNTHTINRK